MYLTAVNSFFSFCDIFKSEKKKDLKLLKYFLYHHMNLTNNHIFVYYVPTFSLQCTNKLCFCIANKYKTLLGISSSKQFDSQGHKPTPPYQEESHANGGGTNLCFILSFIPMLDLA